MPLADACRGRSTSTLWAFFFLSWACVSEAGVYTVHDGMGRACHHQCCCYGYRCCTQREESSVSSGQSPTSDLLSLLCSALLSFGYFSGSILSVVFLADPSTPCGRGRPNVTATFKLIQSQHSSQKRNRKPLMRRRVPAVCVWKPFPTEDNHHYYYYYCHNHYHWLKSVCAGSNDETPLVGGNGSDTVKVDDWPSGGDWGTATHLTDLIFLSLFSLSREGRFCFSLFFSFLSSWKIEKSGRRVRGKSSETSR